MTATRLFMLCLCFSLSHVEGSRLQGKVLQRALDGLDTEQDLDVESPKKFVQTSGKCKAWCQKQATTFPLDVERLKKQADEKCETPRGKRECSGCAGGGLTIPDCREKQIPEEEMLSFALPSAPKQQADTTPQVDGIPQCREGGIGGVCPSCACRFKEGEMCAHSREAWCPPPSRNAGDKFRHGREPLCCFVEEESDMENVEEEKATVQEAVDTQPAATDPAEPAKPVPLCAEGHNHVVQSFQRRSRMVHICRDEDTGRFAKKVCCDPAAFQLLEDKQRAEEVCETVEKEYCKPSIAMFEKKRKEYPSMPSTFSCKRMYTCVEKGDENFGPVPSQSWCMKEKTGFVKNRSARAVCVAVKL